MRRLRGRILMLAVAIVAVAAAGCGGGGVNVAQEVGSYSNRNVSNCRDTGEVTSGLAVFNCGFDDGSEGCYTVNPKDEFSPVKQYYGGANCPDISSSASIKPSGVEDARSTATASAAKLCSDPDYVGGASDLSQIDPTSTFALAQYIADKWNSATQLGDFGPSVLEAFDSSCQTELEKLAPAQQPQPTAPSTTLSKEQDASVGTATAAQACKDRFAIGTYSEEAKIPLRDSAALARYIAGLLKLTPAEHDAFVARCQIEIEKLR